ncbi:MAG: glycosyltransferase [Planctomycetota bacterium]|nr:MAG: glycosyltransferase [Planctomycetota bacterium]REK24388.1 MAG: glycosyltransferase [Planctomycetota bacterium]REK38579.1 MAG: glycosyltransferase [Planctomycetota bacterium]
MNDIPLTVLQVLPSLESGGVERGTLEVGAELVARGHRSLVVSGGGRLVKRLVAEGSEHIYCSIGVKSPLTARWIVPLRQLMRRENVDIVHVRSRVPAWVAWLAWKTLPADERPHFLTTAHGLYSVNRFSAVMTRGERVIAISQTVRDYLLKNYPQLDEDRIRVVYRGVDPGEFPRGYEPSPTWLAAWHSQYPHLAGRRIVTLPGRLTRLKGHPQFLRLIDALRKRDSNIHGLIVGGAEPQRERYAAGLKKLIREMNLDSHVTLTGHRADIREIYSVSDVVVSLSANPPEAFGRTVLEALTLGIPVVGYAHAGVGEILSALYPQGAVPTGRLDLAAKRVQGLLNRPAVVPPNDLFTRRRMLDGTMAVYAELTGRSLPTAAPDDQRKVA